MEIYLAWVKILQKSCTGLPFLTHTVFIYDEIVQEYTEKYKEKKIKQMNIE